MYINYREQPDPLQVMLWDSGRKVTSEYSEDDWKKISIKAIVKRVTEHPMANMFAAPKADSQVLTFTFFISLLDLHI